MFSLIQEVKITSPPPAGTPAMPSWPRPPQAMFSSQDVQGRPPTPATKPVKSSGYPSKAGPQPVDGPKTPISGQSHRQYPCHPPWQSPPGVGLRSPERLIQGDAIGRVGTTIKPMRQASAGPSMALSAYSRTHLGWVHGGAGSGRGRPARTSFRTAAA